jgi:hypothetical protein
MGSRLRVPPRSSIKSLQHSHFFRCGPAAPAGAGTNKTSEGTNSCSPRVPGTLLRAAARTVNRSQDSAEAPQELLGESPAELCRATMRDATTTAGWGCAICWTGTGTTSAPTSAARNAVRWVSSTPVCSGAMSLGRSSARWRYINRNGAARVIAAPFLAVGGRQIITWRFRSELADYIRTWRKRQHTAISRCRSGCSRRWCSRQGCSHSGR